MELVGKTGVLITADNVLLYITPSAASQAEATYKQLQKVSFWHKSFHCLYF